MRLPPFALLAAVVASLVFAATADAAPALGLPDLRFGATESGRTPPTCPFEFTPQQFSMHVSTHLGDSLALNSGSGFQAVPGTLDVYGGGGSVSGGNLVYPGTALQLAIDSPFFFMTGQSVTPLVFTPAPGGAAGFAEYRVLTATPGGPYAVAQILGLELHLTNIHQVGTGEGLGLPIFCADVQGDLAPIVPEPATASLLCIGLAALVGRRRRSTG